MTSSPSSTAEVFDGSDEWRAIDTSGGDIYQWREESTYIQEPPFFTDLAPDTTADRSRSVVPGCWSRWATR